VSPNEKLEEKSMTLKRLEKTIARDKRGYFTILTVCSTTAMLINSITLSSPILGILFSSVYLLINSVFLGHIFFQEESASFRVAFGFIVIIMLIALGGAGIIIGSGFSAIKFDTNTTIAVLTLITIAISFINRLQVRMKLKSKVHESN
jgi:hypothetical protein